MPRPPTVLVVLLVLSAFAPAAGKDGPPATSFRLGPSDLARYERRPVTVVGGEERRGAPAVWTVHGHDLRERGQYAPVDPRRPDLPAVLALRLPGDGGKDASIRLPVRSAIPVRITGRTRVVGEDGAAVRLEGAWSFASHGPEEDGVTHRIASGEASTRAVFDREEGVVREARVTFSYWWTPLDPKEGGEPRRTEATWEYRLVEVRRARYPEFQAHVDAAIDRGVAYLRTRQRPDGSYEPHGNWTIGTTALAALTLASCDVPRSDPALGRALEFLCDRDPPERTYAQALVLMALDRAYTPPSEIAREHRGEPVSFRRDLPEDRRAYARRTAELLESSPGSPGSWSYGPARPRVLVTTDSSNTQYGVLGLRAAARLGIEVRERSWLGAIRHFRLLRERKGPRGSVLLEEEGRHSERESLAATAVPRVAGFRYSARHESAWGSMTCAGIASLAIAREQLRRRNGRGPDARTEREIGEMILGGWAWLDAHWAADRHPGKPGSARYYYYLYSLERAGILTRVRRVGGKDWYFEGAVQLIARQGRNGRWNEAGAGDVPETCFALLFLKRATAPVTHSPR